MEEILFSFIVPCYNVQDYLEECVKSILSQTYRNYEIILVDDGATDSTPELCDRLAASDERICVCHKENGGLSDARNCGMERAKGDYFVFVDSDDFISEKALECFVPCIQESQPDVLLTRLSDYFSNAYIVEQDTGMEAFFSDGVTLEKALDWDMKRSESSWPAQKKILSQNFIRKYKLRFLNGFLHEDVDWSSRVMMYAETFGVCTVPWYYHRMQREGSITNTVSYKRLTDVIKMSAKLIYGEEMHLVADERRAIIADRIMRSVYSTLVFYGELSKEGKAAVVECCKEYRKVFQSAPEGRHKVFTVFVRVFGFRISLSLLAKVGDIV